jgi:hypothetical protein
VTVTIAEDGSIHFDTPPSWEFLGKVEEELSAQDEKWGEQNHPLIGGDRRGRGALREHYALLASEEKERNDRRVQNGTMGWDSILLEEVFEALEAETPEQQIEELIQSAAVCLQAAMSIARGEAA